MSNTLPFGYKETEAGMIPEDWRVVSLGEAFTFKNGLNKAKEFFGHGTPIVNYMDVYESSGLLSNALRGRVAVSRLEQRSFEVKKGDVFFTRTSETVDEVGVTSVLLDDSPGTVFSGFVLRGRPKRHIFEDQFKRYCFSSGMVRNQITSTSSYTTRALTTGRALSRVYVPCPPIPEQRAIAAALLDADALIAALDRLIAKKRDVKQAAMQELLTGRTRLPGFHLAWTTKRLAEVGTFAKGKGIRKDDVVADGLPCIRYGEIYTRHHDCVRRFYSFITPAVAAQSQPLRYGDLLFAGSGETAGEIGKCVVFLGKEPAFAGGDIVILSPVGHDPLFLGYLMNHHDVVNQKMGMAQGDAVVHISAASLRRISVNTPELDEQKAIAAVLSDMDAEIAALEARRDKARLVKEGMIQELLTGRTRLV